MKPNNIKDIQSRMIIDSRGNPTIEVDVHLENGKFGRASVPSGASTGDKEALELRDEAKQWHGKGVKRAIANIQTLIKPALIGLSASDINKVDKTMINLDSTANKSKLGANAMLAVSLATVQAAANAHNMPLFLYIKNNILHNTSQPIMPIPMMNILNGGSHADNTLDIQEFMIMPINFPNYSEALRAGTEIFHTLKQILKTYNYSTSIGDEGGFAPNLKNNEEAIELILESIYKANYKPGEDIYLALDVAASEFYLSGQKKYFLESENKSLSALQLIEYYQKLCKQYPIVSIEDGLDQNDWESWRLLTKTLGSKVQIVGDDLTVTNNQLLQKAIDNKSMNSILIKLNQIGTFTETIKTINLAEDNKFSAIISHRSGETENTFIADLAVASNAGQIKTGSLCRTDRTAKYNQLLRIEEFLKSNAIYADISYLGCDEKIKK